MSPELQEVVGKVAKLPVEEQAQLVEAIASAHNWIDKEGNVKVPVKIAKEAYGAGG